MQEGDPGDGEGDEGDDAGDGGGDVWAFGWGSLSVQGADLSKLKSIASFDATISQGDRQT